MTKIPPKTSRVRRVSPFPSRIVASSKIFYMSWWGQRRRCECLIRSSTWDRHWSWTPRHGLPSRPTGWRAWTIHTVHIVYKYRWRRCNAGRIHCKRGNRHAEKFVVVARVVNMQMLQVMAVKTSKGWRRRQIRIRVLPKSQSRRQSGRSAC